MTYSSGMYTAATLATSTIGPTSQCQKQNNTANFGSSRFRLENVFLKNNRDARRCVHAEDRFGEKRWPALSSSASPSLDFRVGKVGVAAARLDSAVFNKIQASNAKTFTYVVQEGDTLTSIARKTKTSVQVLADANSIEDVDFLLSGQLLQLPINPGGLEMPARPAVGQDEFPIARLYDAKSSSRKRVFPQKDVLSATGGKAQTAQKTGSPKSESSRLAASVQPALPFNLPKLAVPILLLAPLIGFCIRCIVDALSIHMAREDAKEQAERETWEKLHSPKATRWQKILEEDRDGVEEPSVPASEGSAPRNAWSGGDVWTQDGSVQEHTQVEDTIRNETDEEIGLRHKQDYEDIQKSYAELESVYMKFLADSGMSKSGYWRGSGVPTTARLDDGESL